MPLPLLVQPERAAMGSGLFPVAEGRRDDIQTRNGLHYILYSDQYIRRWRIVIGGNGGARKPLKAEEEEGA